MRKEKIVTDRLSRVVSDGFDIFEVSQVALELYQDPELVFKGDLEIALLSLIAMCEGPEFEMTEQEFYDLLSNFKGV